MACAVKNDVLFLHFPIVDRIPDFTYRDFENDGWVTEIIGRYIVKFDPKKREIDLL